MGKVRSLEKLRTFAVENEEILSYQPVVAAFFDITVGRKWCEHYALCSYGNGKGRDCVQQWYDEWHEL
jgi:hypothetical protein